MSDLTDLRSEPTPNNPKAGTLTPSLKNDFGLAGVLKNDFSSQSVVDIYFSVSLKSS